MQELNITEYSSTQNGVGVEPSLCSRTLDYDRDPEQSKIINERTCLVRLVSTSSCRVKFGLDPTVTDGCTILIAGVPEYFALVTVTPDHYKLSVKRL